MRKNNKKGFTIVELVIVIAVIAILAGVLIPTFSTVIKKAKVNSDTQLVRNLNTALVAESVDGAPTTMYDALKIVEEAGYNVEKINASATDNEILWNSKANVFCYLNEGKIQYVPATSDNGASDEDLWVISSSVNATYSTYYTGDNNKTIDTTKGFDAGEKTGLTINVTNPNAVNLTIRTNSNKDIININAPNANINFEGEASEINADAVAKNSLHVFGKVEFLQIKQGRVVAESTAEIKGLHVAANGVEVKVNSQTAVKNVTKSAEVTTTIVTGYTQEIKVANPEDVKVGAKLFASGSGTQELPYIIETAEQLMNITKNYDKYAYYKVADGIESLDCSSWPTTIKLHGSFDGNGVKILNLSYSLFHTVGYKNTNEDIVIENLDVVMNNTKGSAFVRNIFNSGKTSFKNISLHGYIEGEYNMGSFYNYGTANYDDIGASYTVEFENATSDITLVCTTGNGIGGMIGHGYEGTGNTITFIVDEASCYTGKMLVTNNAGGDKFMYMASNGSKFILNGVEESGYDAKYNYATTKIQVINPTKADAVYSIDVVSGAASLKISLNVQITAYDEDGNKIPNLSGMTWVASQETVDVINNPAVVFDKAFTNATIVNNVNDERGIAVEDGVLTLRTASSSNYKEGTIKLFVVQYDTNGNILAVGSILLANIQ